MNQHFRAFSFVDRITAFDAGRAGLGDLSNSCGHRGVPDVARRGGDRTARGVIGDGARAKGPMTCQPKTTPWVIVIKKIKP